MRDGGWRKNCYKDLQFSREKRTVNACQKKAYLNEEINYFVLMSCENKNIQVKTEKSCKQIKNLLLPSSSRSLEERMPTETFVARKVMPWHRRRRSSRNKAALLVSLNPPPPPTNTPPPKKKKRSLFSLISLSLYLSLPLCTALSLSLSLYLSLPLSLSLSLSLSTFSEKGNKSFSLPDLPRFLLCGRAWTTMVAISKTTFKISAAQVWETRTVNGPSLETLAIATPPLSPIPPPPPLFSRSLELQALYTFC